MNYHTRGEHPNDYTSDALNYTVVWISVMTKYNEYFIRSARTKTDWLEIIRIMFPSGATRLPTECGVDDLAVSTIQIQGPG
jgi:hypothetical protein